MDLTSIQNQPEAQRSPAMGTLSRALLGFLCVVFSVGCGLEEPDDLYGVYQIDSTALEHSSLLSDMDSNERESVLNMAQPMMNSLEYVFGREGCERRILGRSEPLPCELRRVEKSGTVVFRSEDRLGRTRFLRLRPTERGYELDNMTRKIPLKRVK